MVLITARSILATCCCLQEAKHAAGVEAVAGLRLIRAQALVAAQRFDDALLVLTRLTGQTSAW